MKKKKERKKEREKERKKERKEGREEGRKRKKKEKNNKDSFFKGRQKNPRLRLDQIPNYSVYRVVLERK